MSLRGHDTGVPMNSVKKLFKSESGSVALMAVFLVFFISILMITLELMRLSDIEIVTNHIENMQAYYCAEAGIEYEIRGIRNAAADPPVAPGCSSSTVQLDCSLNKGTINTGWTFKMTDISRRGDPNYSYCNYDYIQSLGCKGAFVAGACSGTFSTSVGALVKRTNQSTDLTYIQVIRWREL